MKIEDFVKCIFATVFENEISLHLNFKGQKHKLSFMKSSFYEVIMGKSPNINRTVNAENSGGWNREGKQKVSDLEDAIQRRLKTMIYIYISKTSG